MDKRTVEIIMMLKGHSKVKPAQTLKESFIRYLSYLYDCPEKYYTDDRLWSIVREAVQDALASCSGPGQIRGFMLNYFEARKWHDELEAFISALHLMQIREEGEYINGFTKEVVESVLKKLYEKRYEVVMISSVFLNTEDTFVIRDNKGGGFYPHDCIFTFPSEKEAEKGLKKLIEELIH